MKDQSTLTTKDKLKQKRYKGLKPIREKERAKKLNRKQYAKISKQNRITQDQISREIFRKIRPTIPEDEYQKVIPSTIVRAIIEYIMYSTAKNGECSVKNLGKFQVMYEPERNPYPRFRSFYKFKRIVNDDTSLVYKRRHVLNTAKGIRLRLKHRLKTLIKLLLKNKSSDYRSIFIESVKQGYSRYSE